MRQIHQALGDQMVHVVRGLPLAVGPKSNSEHAVRIDEGGRAETIKDPLGQKDWRESAHQPIPSAMLPVITGGTPEGRGHRPPGDALRGQLGLPLDGGHRHEPAPGNRAHATAMAGRTHKFASRPPC